MNTNTPPSFDFSRRSSVSREKLRVAPTEEVQRSLLAFFNQLDEPGAPDFDDIMRVGLLLQANPSDCGRAAVEWLAANVSATRLDIVCAFLYGLWTPDPRPDPPAREVVMRLAALRPAERTEPDADYSYALAMNRVLDGGGVQIETAVTALQELELAATRGTGNSSLDQSLFSLRNRHRKSPASGEGSPQPPAPFRAYAVTGTDFPFVVQRADSNDEIVQVLALSEVPGELKIEYRKCDPNLSNIVAVDAIELALLKVFFQREHSSRVSRVQYVDKQAGFKVVADYPQ
jgi:hypothetical protein